ncbi:MAG: transporter [Planctomycetia bacterium]|nr:transporter [Planctomycetia bacterium]
MPRPSRRRGRRAAWALGLCGAIVAASAVRSAAAAPPASSAPGAAGLDRPDPSRVLASASDLARPGGGGGAVTRAVAPKRPGWASGSLGDSGDPSPPRDGEARPAAAVAAEPAGDGARRDDGSIETGTDPAKLIFRFECNPQYIDSAGDGFLYSTNLKLDLPLSKAFAVAFEVPLLYAGAFPSPIHHQYGLGDIFVRARHVWTSGKHSVIAGVELGLPTADETLLGTGRWQVNPTFAFVRHLSAEYLVVVAAKQRLSVGGDDDRADIDQSELRLIGIRVDPKGKWLQADYQPRIDWEADGRVSHLFELEAGTMLSRSVGVSIRPGFGLGGNRDRDWSLGFGFRVLF